MDKKTTPPPVAKFAVDETHYCIICGVLGPAHLLCWPHPVKK